MPASGLLSTPEFLGGRLHYAIYLHGMTIRRQGVVERLRIFQKTRDYSRKTGWQSNQEPWLPSLIPT